MGEQALVRRRQAEDPPPNLVAEEVLVDTQYVQLSLHEVSCPCCHTKFKPGEVWDDAPYKPGMQGKKMVTKIKELLNERNRNRDGSYSYRFDRVAEAFVAAAESGSFHHLRELIDRLDGRVPTRMANADGENLKAYIALPVEGDQAP